MLPNVLIRGTNAATKERAGKGERESKEECGRLRPDTQSRRNKG